MPFRHICVTAHKDSNKWRPHRFPLHFLAGAALTSKRMYVGGAPATSHRAFLCVAGTQPVPHAQPGHGSSSVILMTTRMIVEGYDVSQIFVELGMVIVGLAVLARFANRFGFSAIPLYLLAGLAFGNGGRLPLKFSEDFTRVGAEIGVLLLLFMLGLEYTGEELKENLRTRLRLGVVDFVLNFPPGLVTGFCCGGISYPRSYLAASHMFLPPESSRRYSAS